MKNLFSLILLFSILSCSNSKDGIEYHITSYSTDLISDTVVIDRDTIFVESDSAAIMYGYILHNTFLRMYYEYKTKGYNNALFNRPDSFFVYSLDGTNIMGKPFLQKDSLIQDLYNKEVSLSKSIYDEKIRYEKKASATRDSLLAHSIKIKNYYLSSPNSASGVSAYFYYKNISKKTIKYLVWKGYPLNAVNDPVSCDIRGYSSYSGKDTGPIVSGGSGGGCWDCAWYNSTAKKLIIESIEIEYMDNSTLSISGKDLYTVGVKK